MSAFWILLPLIFIRFGLLRILDKESLRRAAFFAPLIGKEKVAYIFYQLSTSLIFIYLCFLKINTDQRWLYIGLLTYGLGILLCFISTWDFAKPSEKGINLKGLYLISRNPIYIAYFIFFMGCVLLTQSLILLGIVIAFQISAHWIILSEERWCIQKFGDEYINYMKNVRRYI